MMSLRCTAAARALQRRVLRPLTSLHGAGTRACSRDHNFHAVQLACALSLRSSHSSSSPQPPPPSPSPHGPRHRYDLRVLQATLNSGDAAQVAAADTLQSLFQRVMAVPLPLIGTLQASVRGVYLHGSPGRGKTVLMDMLHGCLVDAGVAAHREHSHRWMLSLHHNLHKLSGKPNKLAAAALQTLHGARVLCLDELEVSDVADASLLRQAYPALRACGVTLVATSNCQPDALYRAGLNREVLFSPFVAELRASCDIVSLDGGSDYRQCQQPPLPSLYATGRAASLALSKTFAALAPAGAEPAPAQVPVPGASRSVFVPMAAGRVCRFSFEELCGSALSAADYLALCAEYDAFVMDDVPVERSNDELRRFITLLDCLYDQNKLLALSATQPLHLLFPPSSPSSASLEQIMVPDSGGWALGLRPSASSSSSSSLSVSGSGGASGRSTTMIGSVEWSATGRSGASLSHLGGGGYAAAASPRAASRLMQMTGSSWAQTWAERHAGTQSWPDIFD